MKFVKILFGLFFLFIFASCYKYKVEDLNGSTGGTGNGSANCKECSYFPTCNGSRFINDDTTNSVVTLNKKDSLIFIKDTVIDGLSCRKILFTNTNSNTYFNCTNGTTTLYSFNSVSLGGILIAKTKRVLLKSASPVGTTWSDSVISASNTTIYNSTITAKGLSVTVNGKSYSNVIEVEVESGANMPIIGFVPVVLQTMYYANNIGLIYTEMEDLFSGSVLQSSGLVSYYIP